MSSSISETDASVAIDLVRTMCRALPAPPPDSSDPFSQCRRLLRRSAGSSTDASSDIMSALMALFKNYALLNGHPVGSRDHLRLGRVGDANIDYLHRASPIRIADLSPLAISRLRVIADSMYFTFGGDGRGSREAMMILCNDSKHLPEIAVSGGAVYATGFLSQREPLLIPEHSPFPISDRFRCTHFMRAVCLTTRASSNLVLFCVDRVFIPYPDLQNESAIHAAISAEFEISI